MRIKLYRNGQRADGQKFIVPETWEALLEKASRALSTATEPFAASRLFDDHGFEIKELEVLEEDDLIIVSAGENFVAVAGGLAPADNVSTPATRQALMSPSDQSAPPPPLFLPPLPPPPPLPMSSQLTVTANRPRTPIGNLPMQSLAAAAAAAAAASSPLPKGSAREPAEPAAVRGPPDCEAPKPRFIWTPELHARFEAAVQALGVEQAKPNAILVQMGCEGEGAPTRANVKSHLQKYRLWLLKRERGEPLLGHSLGHRDVAAGPVTAGAKRDRREEEVAQRLALCGSSVEAIGDRDAAGGGLPSGWVVHVPPPD